MRILFLHLSDLHFEKQRNISNTHIEQIASALSPGSIGSVDKILVFVTGDIAFSGRPEQYKIFDFFKRRLIKELKKSVIKSPDVDVFLVPGNHDIDYRVLDRNRKECEEMIGNLQGMDLTNEVKAQSAFLKYSSSQDHFLNFANPYFAREIIDIDGFVLEINLLNSTVFSLLNENDQGIHIITEDAINHLTTPTGANMAVTLMHHSHQWFNDSCKPQLEKALLEKNTMVFCGHEHFQATQAISYNGKMPVQFFCGGSLCDRGDWTSSEYFACVYDVENGNYAHYKFQWDLDNNIYKKSLVHQGALMPKYSVNLPTIKNLDQVQSILSDAHIHITDNITDYYVFPGVVKEAPNKDVQQLNDIFNLDAFLAEIEENKRIELCGTDTCGKSALLKMIFNHYVANKCVLFCKVEDITSGNRRRIIKSLFEELYGEEDADFQKFERLNKEYKMILIDDLHMINPKHVSTFLSGIEEEFGYVIYTSSNTIKLDIEERIKSAIAKDSYLCYKLHHLYSVQRKELVLKVLAIKNLGMSMREIEAMAGRISQALDLQRRYVPLTPEIIIKFIEYFSTYQMESAQNDGSIFGKVFESSITNTLLPCVRAPLTVDKAFLILGKIALHAHNNKHYPISIAEVLEVIDKYCEEYGGKIDGVAFINSVLASRILICCADGKYKFCNTNYYAYFIAYEICNTKNREVIEECFKVACFGIYSNILMFVTYITNEDSIINMILEAACFATRDWNEFSFSMDEISHINCRRQSTRVLPPSQEDIQQDQQADIEKDREEIDNFHIDVISIYDYNEDDICKLENQLARSISLMMLLARCLPNFEHRLKKEQKEAVIKALYSLPNKIFYIWASNVEAAREELMHLITTLDTNEFARHKTTLEEAREILQWNSLSLLLELYHCVVNNAYRENTEEFLADMAKSLLPFDEETHVLQYLLVLCKSNRFSDFMSTAEGMEESCKFPAAELALRRVVYHLLLRGGLTTKQVARIETKFFPELSRPATIYQRKLEERKK